MELHNAISETEIWLAIGFIVLIAVMGAFAVASKRRQQPPTNNVAQFKRDRDAS